MTGYQLLWKRISYLLKPQHGVDYINYMISWYTSVSILLYSSTQVLASSDAMSSNPLTRTLKLTNELPVGQRLNNKTLKGHMPFGSLADKVASHRSQTVVIVRYHQAKITFCVRVSRAHIRNRIARFLSESPSGGLWNFILTAIL